MNRQGPTDAPAGRRDRLRIRSNEGKPMSQLPRQGPLELKRAERDRVIAFLRAHGAPFEMSVSETFRKHGFSATQSHFYLDAESGKERETDILVQRFEDLAPVSASVRYTLTVECKYTTGTPWVFFTSVPSQHYRPDIVRCNKEQRSRYLKLNRNGKFWKSVAAEGIGPIAYGCAEVKKSGQETSYSATQSALSAAKYFEEFSDTIEDDLFQNLIKLTAAVVVVSGTLYEAHLENGELAVSEIPYACLMGRTDGVAQVVSYDALDEFAGKIKLDIDSWAKAIAAMDRS